MCQVASKEVVFGRGKIRGYSIGIGSCSGSLFIDKSVTATTLTPKIFLEWQKKSPAM